MLRKQPSRHTLRGTLMVVAALLLAGCDQQAQKASSDTGSAAVKSSAGDVATTQQPADQAVRIIIKPQFDEADSFSEGLAAVRVGAKYGYIDKQGKIVIKPQLDCAGPFSEGLAVKGE